MSSRLSALSYLAWRALAAQPAKRLAQRGSGLDRFLGSYASEGLAPATLEDHAAAEAASACISCGLCESACELAGAAPSIRDLGLHAAFRLHAKSAGAVAWAREALAACAGCTGCEPLCPTGIPISRLVRHYLDRAADRAEPGGGGPRLP
jgi:succinate dehydrogenase/fumarate reductase-like Fe-S protein